MSLLLVTNLCHQLSFHLHPSLKLLPTLPHKPDTNIHQHDFKCASVSILYYLPLDIASAANIICTNSVQIRDIRKRLLLVAGLRVSVRCCWSITSVFVERNQVLHSQLLDYPTPFLYLASVSAYLLVSLFFSSLSKSPFNFQTKLQPSSQSATSTLNLRLTSNFGMRISLNFRRCFKLCRNLLPTLIPSAILNLNLSYYLLLSFPICTPNIIF